MDGRAYVVYASSSMPKIFALYLLATQGARSLELWSQEVLASRSSLLHVAITNRVLLYTFDSKARD